MLREWWSEGSLLGHCDMRQIKGRPIGHEDASELDDIFSEGHDVVSSIKNTPKRL